MSSSDHLTLAIGSDHGGFELKEAIISFLKGQHPNINVKDYGTHSQDSVDYPDFADQVVSAILDKDADEGILICGTGIGISMRANRSPGIRAALVYDADTARLSREHNNANIICLGGRKTSPDQACQLVSIWLKTAFEGGRHQRRIDKLDSAV